jgi:hypothetical protein
MDIKTVSWIACVFAAIIYVSGHGLRLEIPKKKSNSSAETIRCDMPTVIKPRQLELLEVSVADHARLRTLVQIPAGVHPSRGHCLHLLHVYGLDGHFPNLDLDVPTSEAVVRTMTDGAKGERFYGGPVLMRTRSGLRVPTGLKDMSMEAHRDQTLATFGELGLPLSHPITYQGAAYSLRELIDDSIANFHLEQEEITWTGLAYAMYLPPTTSWVNRYGERYDFDRLAEEMLKRPLDKSSCDGMHLILTLTILLRVDRRVPILSRSTREQISACVAGYVSRAVDSQLSDGSWRMHWYRKMPGAMTGEGHAFDDAAESTLLVTGHLSEWLLYIPDELFDGRVGAAQEKAGRWLLDFLRKSDAERVNRLICPYSHSVAALLHLSYAPKAGALLSVTDR